MLWFLMNKEQRLVQLNARIDALEETMSGMSSVPRSWLRELVDLRTERNYLTKDKTK